MQQDKKINWRSVLLTVLDSELNANQVFVDEKVFRFQYIGDLELMSDALAMPK